MACSKQLVEGYRVTESDQRSLPFKYFCSLCKRVLREPLQTNCGHFYCRSCYQSSRDPVDGSFVCLLDDVSLTSAEVYPDTFMKREILSLTLNCPNECDWSGEVRNVEAHFSKCPKALVQCPNTRCKVPLKRCDLPRHLEEECSFGRRACSYCSKMIVGADMDEHHKNSCEKVPVKCSACGKADMNRQQLKTHQDCTSGDCPGTKMDCAFEAVGCRAEKSMKRADAKRHDDICSVFHLSLLLRFVLTVEKTVQDALSAGFPGVPDFHSVLQEAISKIDGVISETKDVRQKLRDHDTRLKALETRSGAHGSVESATAMLSSMPFPDKNGILPHEISRKLADLENRVADHEVLICDGSQRSNGDVQQINNLKRQLDSAQETIRRLERRIEATEHSLAMRNIALADLEEYVRQQEVSSYDGVLLWKITDFARRKNDAISGKQQSFYSPCFYTSRHGYKMCARIYLNGDGMGRGTHISVFFTVMRGMYDALLRWPFRQKVTIMLLDQDSVEHVIDAFRPDPNSASFQKPRREMNVASGCPLFCSLAELNKHAYVRDDAMFMKILVDTSDL